MSRYFFDIETDGLLDKLTQVHSLVLKDVDHGFGFTCHDHGKDAYPGCDVYKHLTLEEGLRLLMEADQIIGHNIIKFDIPAIQKVYPWFHIQDDLMKSAGKTRKVIDTLNLSRLIWTDLKDRDFGFRKKRPEFPGNLIGRHGLEAWGWRLGLHKGDYSKEMKEAGLDPWAVWNPKMQSYCEQDVEVTAKFFHLIESKNYSADAIDLEHDFQLVIDKQENFGFPFNERAAQELYSTLAQLRIEHERDLQNIFPPWWKPTRSRSPNTKRTFIPCTIGVEKKYERVTTKGKRVVKYRSDMSNKVWATHDWQYDCSGYFEYQDEGTLYTRITLQTFNPGSRDHIADRLMKVRGWKPTAYGNDGKPTVDDEVLGSLKYPEAKALTKYLVLQKRIGQLAEGRQACLKLVKDDGRIYGRVITNGAVTGRCTHQNPNVAQTPAIGAEYGKEFRSCYYAPEGWKLVGADASGLELRCLAHYMARFDGGAYAKELLEGDIHTANQRAAGLPTRDNAKTFIYGFLYGAGDAKIGQIVGQGAKRGKALKAAFLERTPALKQLRKVVIKKAKQFGQLRGVDGRLLHVRSPHSALNALLQGAGALAVKKATVLLYQDLSTRGYKFGEQWAMVAHVHDEVQLLVRDGLEEEIGNAAVRAFQQAGKYFNFRCPLDGEFKVGSNWAETH